MRGDIELMGVPPVPPPTRENPVYRCQDHLITGVFPLLKLWQSVRERAELNEEVFLGSIQRSIASMGSAFVVLSPYRRHRFKQVFSDNYSSLLQDPVTPSRFLFGGNLHEKLKKFLKSRSLQNRVKIRVIIIVIFENAAPLHRTSTRGVEAIAEGLYSGRSTQRMSITKPSTNRKKKTHRLTSAGRLKFFQSEWEKICTDKTVLNYVKFL